MAEIVRSQLSLEGKKLRTKLIAVSDKQHNNCSENQNQNITTEDKLLCEV